MANSATLTFSFTGTDFTRKYKFDDLTQAQCEALKTNVKAINASLTAGTAGGLSAFFISDDFDATQGIGYFEAISAAQYEASTITEIDLTA